MKYTDVRAALIAAFPPRPITLGMIDEPTSRWWNSDDGDAMKPWLEGRCWTELGKSFIEAFPEVMIYAGTETYGAVLPAYLGYLIDFEGFNHVPFVVAHQLTRQDDAVDQRIFDARIAPLTPEQRALVTQAIELLTTRPPMEDVMKLALKTWQSLPGSAR